MNIDISKIVNDKIEELESEGIIQKRVEETVEKVVLNEISDALDSWGLRRNISDAVKSSVGDIADKINFSAYNGFIVQTMKNIMEGTLREDLTQKIQKSFKDILITKHENVKLSEIFNKYYNWVCESTGESEKWERREFTHSLDVREDGNFKFITVKFNDETLASYEDPQIEFQLYDYKNQGKNEIKRLFLEGKDMTKAIVLGSINDFEVYILNLFYNKAEIILDIDDVEENGYYDIDC